MEQYYNYNNSEIFSITYSSLVATANIPANNSDFQTVHKVFTGDTGA